MFEAVSYDLPKSVSFHQAAKGKPRRALAQIREMLATMADDIQISQRNNLWVNPPSEWTDATVANACLDQARAKFGVESNPHERGASWDLAPEQLDAAIAFALSDDQWPKQKVGPLNLIFAYHFNWRDFSKDFPQPLASWQRGTCTLMLNFHRRALAVAPNFVFPVPYEGAEFGAFVERLRAAVPFEMKEKHFRRMLVNPENGAIRHRRLA
jgi:hypothetical protein